MSGPPRTRRGGNLLVSALFMAAFLFFLSVALTVTNRQDIRATLLADHKMRAELAADGALAYAIQWMRSQPDWEQSLTSQKFASGAEARIRWSRPSPGMVELQVVGDSNLVTAERRWLLQEYRLADSLASGGKRPHLFGVASNLSAWVLGPNFRWQDLGPIFGSALPRTIAAAGGPVFFATPEQGSQPPQSQDWQVSVDAQGFVQVLGFGSNGQQLPRGHKASWLSLEEQTFVPQDLPDPGDQLGRVQQATINGSENGQSTWQVLPNGRQVDVSEYRGPCVEWYVLTGTGAAAGPQDTFLCHGLHVYQRGIRFKNTPGAQPPGQVSPGGNYQEPCLLRYLSASKTWEIALDLLKVSDDLSEPEVIPGPRPDTAYLWVDSKGQIFCKQQGADILLSAQTQGFKELQPFSHKPLVAYREQLLSPVPRADQSLGLSQHDPAQSLPQMLPGRNLEVTCAIPGVNLTLPPQAPLKLSYPLDPSLAASAEDDLFVMLRVRGDSDDPKVAPQFGPTQLAHFDGQSWQILPTGLAAAFPQSSAFIQSQRDYRGRILPAPFVQLALAGYRSQQPLLRRYQPIVRY